MTNKLIPLAALSVLLLAAPPARGQDNPFRQYDEVSTLARARGYRGVRDEIKATLANAARDALTCLRLAELMKHAGDVRAEVFYAKAIAADSAEPAYELFYADYLRNFRGAGRPLFSAAERHYFRAQEKLELIGQKREWDEETGDRVERGLVALYQEDGVPVLHSRRDDGGAAPEPPSRPLLFFASVNRLAQLTGDFDNGDDARGFTSEALLAASRLGADLSDDDLRKLARVKNQGETLERLRVRRGAWPALDFYFKRRKVVEAQVSNFFRPGQFNDVDVDTYGIGVEKSLAVARNLDLFVRGDYAHVRRKGLIEFLPGERDEVNQLAARAAVSRFFGPDKAILEAAYVFQDIEQAVPVRTRRGRHIAAATFTYQLLRFASGPAYGNRFGTRGVDLSAGVVNDRERFGSVALVKRDYFAGVSFKGLGAYEIAFRPALFTAEVAGDPDGRKNAQYRTNLSLLWRIKDEEDEPGLPEKPRWLNPAFVHLSFPFRHDVAVRGPNKFENYGAGVALHAKFFTTGARRATFLTSAGYNFQRFPRLDKSLNLLSCSFSVGF